MYFQGWHDTHKSIATFFSFSAGFAAFMSLLSLLRIENDNKFVKQIASISYEVYLVHLPLLPLSGYLVRLTGVNAKPIIILVWLVATYLCAYGAHYIANKISDKLKQYVIR